MSEIEKVKEPQKLFKYAINRHLEIDRKEKLHFYRVNRWRFNTFNRFNCIHTFTQLSNSSNSKVLSSFPGMSSSPTITPSGSSTTPSSTDRHDP